MNWNLNPLLPFFKVMADENRLKIVALLNKREHRVGELAEILGLKEPTVSHHLSKLRALGLLNLRVDGNSHYYRLNHKMLERLSELVVKLEYLNYDTDKPVRDAWIDDLDIGEEDRKVLRNFTSNGRIKQIPAKEKKLLVILRWLVDKFEPDVMYSEREVNEILVQYNPDYAQLRRDLVDFGFLRRERGGGKYWLTPEDEEN